MVNCTPGSGISTMVSYLWTVASWSSCACLWSIFHSRVYFSIKYSLSFSHPLHSSIGLCKTLMFLVMAGNWRSVWPLICGGFHIYCFSFCSTWGHYQVSVGYCFSGQAREVPLPKSVYTDCQLSYRNQSSRVHKPYEQKQELQISVIHRIYSPSTQTAQWISPLFFFLTTSLSPLILLSSGQFYSSPCWAWLSQQRLHGWKWRWYKKEERGPLIHLSQSPLHMRSTWSAFSHVHLVQSVLSGSQKFAGRALDRF